MTTYDPDTPPHETPPHEFFMWLDENDKPVTGTRHRSFMTAIKWKTAHLPRAVPRGAHEQQAAAVKLRKAKIVFEDLTDQEQLDLEAIMRLHNRNQSSG